MYKEFCFLGTDNLILKFLSVLLFISNLVLLYFNIFYKIYKHLNTVQE